MVIVICWYYNQRDQSCPIFPEMSGVFGPFADREAANKWVETQDKWGGWGEYKYQVENLVVPEGAACTTPKIE